MSISKVSLKVALPIIVAGIFIMAIFIALNYERLDFNFYLIFGLLTIYTFLFGFATGQNISRPVQKLLRRADELSKGDLKTRVYLETKDEFGELSGIFNKIADELEESYSAGERAEKSVDLKVKARTQGLEEIINSLEQKVKNRTIELEKISAESNKLKDETKNRETEVAGLRSEIDLLKEEMLARNVSHSDAGGNKYQTKKPAIKKTKEEII